MDPKLKAALSAHFSTLGAKGGAAGKGTPERADLNRKAAKARWAKVKAAKAKQ